MKFLDRLHPYLRRSGADDDTGDPVLDYFVNTPATSSYDRQTGGHRLDEGSSEGFFSGRMNQQVCLLEYFGK